MPIQIFRDFFRLAGTTSRPTLDTANPQQHTVASVLSPQRSVQGHRSLVKCNFISPFVPSACKRPFPSVSPAAACPSPSIRAVQCAADKAILRRQSLHTGLHRGLLVLLLGVCRSPADGVSAEAVSLHDGMLDTGRTSPFVQPPSSRRGPQAKELPEPLKSWDRGKSASSTMMAKLSKLTSTLKTTPTGLYRNVSKALHPVCPSSRHGELHTKISHASYRPLCMRQCEMQLASAAEHCPPVLSFNRRTPPVLHQDPPLRSKKNIRAASTTCMSYVSVCLQTCCYPMGTPRHSHQTTCPTSCGLYQCMSQAGSATPS